MNTSRTTASDGISEDVIIDLAPLYFANEASPASRALVDRYFALHPAFAAALRASQGATPNMGVPPARKTGEDHAAVTRVRKLLRLRSGLMGLAIACTLAPLSFTFSDGHNWSMLRDAPGMALAYGVAAAVAWVAYAIVVRKTRTP